jgi:hypothetical protein
MHQQQHPHTPLPGRDATVLLNGLWRFVPLKRVRWSVTLLDAGDGESADIIKT